MLKKTQKLLSLIPYFRKKQILVIGDIMLDRYIFGSVNRISPEAPVPVVEVEKDSFCPGGASNVANNIRSLSAIPIMVGVVGDDINGKIIIDEFKKQNLDTSGIIVDDTRPTTTKTRIIAHHQQVVRVDREIKEDISSKTARILLNFISSMWGKADAILLEDYNKGLFTTEIIEGIIELNKKKRKIVTVDPKFDHFFDFKGFTVFKPNQKECENALGIRITDDESLIQTGETLLEKLKCECLLITRGEKGMVLFDNSDNRKVQGIRHKTKSRSSSLVPHTPKYSFDIYNIPAIAKEVYDVSGAGDTVISTLTLGLSAGGSFIESAYLATYAASVVVSKTGVVPIDKDELIQTIKASKEERKKERSK